MELLLPGRSPAKAGGMQEIEGLPLNSIMARSPYLLDQWLQYGGAGRTGDCNHIEEKGSQTVASVPGTKSRPHPGWVTMMHYDLTPPHDWIP